MPWRVDIVIRATIVFLLAVIGASDAAAQVPGTVVQQAEAQPFAGRKAGVLYSIEQGGSWSLVSVFSQPFGRSIVLEPDAPRRWIARRQSGRAAVFSDDVKWADSASCAALPGVLWSLARLIIPSVMIDGISPDRPSEGAVPVVIDTDGRSIRYGVTAFSPAGFSGRSTFVRSGEKSTPGAMSPSVNWLHAGGTMNQPHRPIPSLVPQRPT